MVTKSPDAFRTISEVADILDIPAHVLRFWESRFSQIKPVKRGGGRRYYRRQDIDLLRGIRDLLYRDGLTIKGVQKILREQGVKHVAGLGHLDPAQDPVVNPDVVVAAEPAAKPAPKPSPAADTPVRSEAAIDFRAAAPKPVAEAETQIDLFAHADQRAKRPFPPDPARAARAEQLRMILGKLERLREKMGAGLA